MKHCIYMIAPGLFHPGLCHVCGQPALIKYRDTQTGFMLGDCCLRHFVAAKQTMIECSIHEPVNRTSTR